LLGAAFTRFLLWVVRELWADARFLYYRRRLLKKSEFSHYLSRLLNNSVVLITAAVSVMVIARWFPDSEDGWTFFFSSMSIVVFGQLLLFGFTHKPLPTKVSPLDSERQWFTEVPDEDIKAWAPYPIMMVSLSAFLYINLFGTLVYPEIPQSIGGARPREVQILFAGEDTSDVRLLGIPTVLGGRLSTTVKLLYLAGDQIYVQANGESVVQIDRKHINGICFAKAEAVGENDNSQPSTTVEVQCARPRRSVE
jgi:hypothetical protein